MPTVGEGFKAAGYSPNLPLLVVPGLCSSILRVQETTYEPWADKRIWLNLNAIGLGKVWDFNITLFGDSKKKPKPLDDNDRNEDVKDEVKPRSNTTATKQKSDTKTKKSRRERRKPEDGDDKKQKTPKRKNEDEKDEIKEEEEEDGPIQVADVDDNLKVIFNSKSSNW